MKNLITLLAFGLLQFSYVAAQRGICILDSYPSDTVLMKCLEIAEDEPSNLTIDDILSNAGAVRFQPYKDWEGRLQPLRYYWARVILVNRLPDAQARLEWVLDLSTSLTDITAFQVLQNGSISQSRSGIFMPYHEKTFAPAADPNLVKVALPPGETVAIYIRARSERAGIAPEFKVQFQHADDYYKERWRKKWSNGLFFGFIFMMLMYNLVLLIYFRDRAYLFYSFYLVTIAVYSAYTLGDLGDLLTPPFFAKNPQYLFLSKIVIYLGLIFYLAFIRTFLHLRRTMPKWDSIFKWLMYLGIPAMALDIYLLVSSNFSYAVADFVSITYTVAFILTSLVFLWPLFQTRDKKGYFIIIGFIAMSVGFSLTVKERLQHHTFTMIPFKIGTTLEIVAFSLGLAYRQRQNEREKQRARFEKEQEHAEAMRLKELNDFKNKFFANITHEFRTPLTVILGLTEQTGQGTWKEKDKTIHRNAGHVLRLINRILDLSKLESGNLKLDLIQADIVSYIKYLMESLRSYAASKKIEMVFYSEADRLEMDFDEEKIQQIVYNLLSNAVKFTPGGGKVILHLREEELDGQSRLRIKVKDTGIGISEKDLPHIFDRYFSIPPPDSIAGGDSAFQGEGAGIGLAFVKDLVSLMGGSIEVKSRQGHGSEFDVLLPISRRMDRVEPVYEAVFSEVGEPIAAYGDPQRNDRTGLPDGPVLLVVEDNQDIVDYICSLLQDDYIIEVALDGQEGVEKAYEIIPDIIISDVMMPRKDGFELCRELKADERTSHIPIVLLTARAGEDDKMEGLRGGADAYLTKPFKKEELFVRLEKLVELRKRLLEHYSTLAAQGLPEKTEPTLEDAFLAKLKQVVEENISDSELAVHHLYRAVGLSHSQLIRKLKALVDMTPSQFIRSIRLNKARELLRTTKMNVSEIAYDLGFTDPNYFTRIFAEEFGFPPSDMRK
jgi:signal transduction histidine kinase/DNA-binding response OmpR family regulator